MTNRKRNRLILVGIIIVILFSLYQVLDKPLPKGTKGAAAEALTDKMLFALNKAAWDTTYAVKWKFYNDNQYLWDRKRDLVQVRWDDYEVLLNTTTQQGKAYEKGILLESVEHGKALTKAWENFANDSFWLIAPYKIRDPGTERFIVKRKNRDALLVRYNSGGVTPGDSYLWILDENGMPKEWRLWVKIIPVGGIAFSWEDWKTFNTGAKIALLHSGPFDIRLSDVEVGNDISEIHEGADPFKRLY